MNWLPDKHFNWITAPEDARFAIIPMVFNPGKLTTVGADQSVGWNSFQEVWWLIVHDTLIDQFPVEPF